ncbi:substrate-binding domain-containing protein [Marinococcus luteus]|uniref:substrate-binding domain-containing protein n=1 Tax=Marinococcus luteus TaxID=1122204 RepID=UPI002ACCD1FF|nr:substrate-binding domain-containing protein [Marinococcus luteus]MDZ5783117.1 substrate-binding domain-containing protein [Marinococcus luteus]
MPEQLQQGMYDLALLIESPDWHPPELTVRALAEEPLQLVQASFKTQENSSLTDLMLMTSHACSWRPVFKRLLRYHAYEHTTTVELPSAPAIKQCLLTSLGTSLFPRLVVQDELRTGQLQSVPLTTPLAPLQVSICWHKDKHLTSAMQAFIHSMQVSI